MLENVLEGVKTAYLAARGIPTLEEITQPTPTIPWRPVVIAGVAFFKDSRRVVTSSDNTVRIWDVEKGALIGRPSWEKPGHYGVSSCLVAISPDDRRIASSARFSILIWDVDKQKVVPGPLEKHTDWVRTLCFSPDSKRLASGSFDGRVIIWDAETGAVLSTLARLIKNHMLPVMSVAFSPDGLKLASGMKCIIRVWSTDNAEPLFDISAHTNWVRGIVWSPDGQQIVSASEDKTIKFWDSSNGFLIGRPCIDVHTDVIYSLAISSDGSFIASASHDKTVRLWSTKSQQQIGHALEHTERVRSVAISPNGELLVSEDFDGNFQLWPVENILSAAFGMDSSYDFYFAHRSKVKLGQDLYVEALADAEKVQMISAIDLTGLILFAGR
jgi:WD40 repeat protein